MGATVLGVEKLKIESNPFDAGLGNGRVGRPLRQTLGEVLRQIGFETPVVVVSGSPGTGKTLLAKMARRACEDMGLSVRRIARGDFVDVAAGQRSDVLMVDEADSLPESTLRMLLFEGDKRPATTTVLLCLPASTRRFSTVAGAVFVELTRLSQSDTRLYVQERATHAGLPDLFTPTALDLIVDASRGVPRSLWSIAGLAYFSAASAGASQISRQNVADAVASQIAHLETPEPAVPTAPAVKLVSETPVVNPAVPPVPNPPRASENVALFPGGAHLPTRRVTSAEAPTPQMPPSKPQEPIAESTSAPTIATIIRRLEPIAPRISELPKSVAAAPDRSAASDGELRIDREKAGDVPPMQGAHSEPIAFHVRDEMFVFVDTPETGVAEPISKISSVAVSSAPLVEPIAETPVNTLPVARPVPMTRAEPARRAQVIPRAAESQSESPKSAQAASTVPLGLARANAMERAAARRPLVNVGRAVGAAAVLAAAVALTIYLQPMSEKPAVATGVENNSISAPIVANPASPAPANPPSIVTQTAGTNGAKAAGQAVDTGGAARRASNSSRAGTRAGQRGRRTRAERLPSSPPDQEFIPATRLAEPIDNNTADAAPVRVEAGRNNIPSYSTEVDATAAPVMPVKSFADYAREAATQVGAPTTRPDAKDIAERQAAQAKAAQEEQAVRDERDRERRAFNRAAQFRFNQGLGN